MSYFIWVPLLFITVIIQSWLSVKSNGGADKWFWINYLYVPTVMLLCPLWPLIAKNTKNIVFDGILFDSIMIIGFALFLALFSGKLFIFSGQQILGISLVIIGLIIFKV